MALLAYMRRLLLLAAAPGFLWSGCTTIKTEHHIVLDHHITVQIEKEVDDFLDDLYGEEETTPPAAPETSPPKENE